MKSKFRGEKKKKNRHIKGKIKKGGKKQGHPVVWGGGKTVADHGGVPMVRHINDAGGTFGKM